MGNLLWKQSRNAAYNKAERVIANHFKNNNKDKHLLIFVDDNMHFRSMRYKYFKLAKLCSSAFLIIHFMTNCKECIRRNALRSNIESVNECIIQKMSKEFEAPNNKKYEWEYKNCFNLASGSNEEINSLCNKISDSWMKIPPKTKVIDVKQKNDARIANQRSLRHRSDLKLRHSVSKWINLLKNEKKKKKKKNLQKNKKKKKKKKKKS